METTNNKKLSKTLKLIIGSIIGIVIFIIPVTWKGEMTIVLWLLANFITGTIGFLLPIILMIVLALSFLGAIWLKIKPTANYSEFIQQLFATSPFMVIIRFAAFVFYVLAYFMIGPEPIWGPNTGGLITKVLMPNMLALFFVASILLPLLTDFGTMEIFGHFLRPVFKPLFRLPGKSSVLALSSWFGSGTVGMLITDEEYKNGEYTAREGAILCFGFCTIPLSSIFAYTVSIGGVRASLFPYFFLCTVVVAIVSTSIMCRIPPISSIPDKYYEGAPAVERESDKETFKEAFDKAYVRVCKAPGIGHMIKDGTLTTVRLAFDVFPLVTLLASIVLIIAEYTTVFNIISMPILPLIKLLHIPEAAKVAPAMIIGFADLLLPYLAATGVTSQLSKFIICVVSTMQIICMSETGAIMLKTKMPVEFSHVLFSFLEKTIIALVIALVMGRLIGLS